MQYPAGYKRRLKATIQVRGQVFVQDSHVHASKRKTEGLFSRSGVSLRHCATVMVRINSDGRVMSAAMHSLVEGWHTARISAIILLFLNGVSMKICVGPPAE